MSADDSYSSLDGFIVALVEGLRERPGLEGIQVEDAWPGDDYQGDSSVWVHDAWSSRYEPVFSGGRPVVGHEEYTVEVICDVFLPGGTTAEARTTCNGLAGEVLRYIAEEKRIITADNKVCMARVAGWEAKPYARAEGRGIGIKLKINVTARR